jgi:hypothetical protein
MKVSHTCPHCGSGKNSAEHVSKHKCRMCGGSWSSLLSSATNMAKKVASNPMVQKMASSAMQKYAPGLASKAQAVMSHPMAQRAIASPYGQAALGAVRSRVGLGRKRRGGFGWGDVMNLGKSAVSAVQSAASNPMLQQLAQAAAPHAMAAAQRYAPGAVSAANRAVGAYNTINSNPYGQAALGAVRSRVGLGRKRKAHPKYGAMLALGQMTPGEEDYATKRASGRRRKGGKGGLPGGLGMATQVLGAIPGAAEALGPFGALLGIEPPPPPPPHATFSAVRAGPVMSARPRTVGRGGFGWGDVMNLGKKAVGAVKSAASNPMLQQLASAASPYAMQAAQRYAPGAVSAYNKLSSNPYGQAALGAVRSRVGLGKRKRAPTAHSLAVGRVMKQTGMGLAQASKYVKENGLAQ